MALKWLVSPNVTLAYLATIDFIETENGVEEILNVLGRIEHGIFS